MADAASAARDCVKVLAWRRPGEHPFARFWPQTVAQHAKALAVSTPTALAMNHGRSLLHTVNHTIGCFDDPSYEGEGTSGNA